MPRMNRTLSLLIIFIITSAVSIYAQSTPLDLPRVSQKATVSQRIGLLDVIISYSRPNVKGRAIWGDLVPFGQVWRTGADEATTISVSEDVSLNGNKLAAGKYALFTIPGKEEWTVIINRNAKQWGAFNYDSSKDVIRFKVKPRPGEYTESLEFSFPNITPASAEVDMKWEKVMISFTIDFDLDAKAYSNIKKALENPAPDDWVVYAAAANYAAERNIHVDEAMQWVNKSIQIKPDYYNYYVKAHLLANKKSYKDALANLEKSRKEGKRNPEFKNFSAIVDKLEKEVKAKM